MLKQALVLAGGGSRGSYQIGVWQGLRELGWDFDIVTGTSVGALNGALAVQGDLDTAVEMWERISTADVLAVKLNDSSNEPRHLNETLSLFLGEMAKNGGADPRPLEALLRRHINEARVLASPVDFAVVTVEYPSFTPRVIDKATLPAGELVDYLMASAACFPAMKMRQIGASRYIDGGYYDNMPVQLAVERGATDVVAVDLESIGRTRRFKAPKGVRVRTLRCRWDLGVFLLFEAETAKRNMRLGYLDALKAFGRFEGEAYAFHPGEAAQNGARLGPMLVKLAQATGLAVQKYRHAFDEPSRHDRLARLTRTRVAALPTPAAVTAAGETAARLLELSPLEPYSFAAFNGALREALRRLDAGQMAALEQKLSAATAGELYEALRLIDRPLIVSLCCELVRRALKGELGLLALAAAVLPDECVAACYLVALELIDGD